MIKLRTFLIAIVLIGICYMVFVMSYQAAQMM